MASYGASQTEWSHTEEKEREMGPYPEFYLAEHEYRREQLRDVRRAKSVRKAIRLRKQLAARRAEREALVRVA